MLKTSPPPSRPSSSRFDRFRDKLPAPPKLSATDQSSETASPIKSEIIGLASTRNNALTLVTNFNPSWADPFELIAQARLPQYHNAFNLILSQTATSLHLSSSTAALKAPPPATTSESAARSAREALFSMGLKDAAGLCLFLQTYLVLT
jgi:hypothetical protein